MTQAYPLRWPEGWPRAKARKNAYSAFKVTPETAMRSLFDNLKMLRATGVVISSNCKQRADGFPYAEDLKYTGHKDPGVAAYFVFLGRPMVMAQDAYNAPYANMRSLALAIDAMRAIERHGGGHMMQRSFDGFAQLPPPKGHSAAAKKPWRLVLDMPIEAYGELPSDAQSAVAETRYRKLGKERHPDQAGGSADAMAELNLAIEDARAELAS